MIIGRVYLLFFDGVISIGIFRFNEVNNVFMYINILLCEEGMFIVLEFLWFGRLIVMVWYFNLVRIWNVLMLI